MTELATITLAFAAATDIGCSRANNEDSFGYDNDAASLRRLRWCGWRRGWRSGQQHRGTNPH